MNNLLKSKRKYFKSFQEFYAQDIEPRVNWQRHRFGTICTTIGSICVGIVCFAIRAFPLNRIDNDTTLVLLTNFPLVLALIVCIVLAGGGLIIIGQHYLQSLSKDYILQKMAEALDLHYNPHPKSLPEGLLLASRYRFAPKLKKGYELWGEEEGLLIDLIYLEWQGSEGRVENQLRGEHSGPCHGFCISCHLRKPVQGYTVLVPDGLGAKFAGQMAGMKRIKLEWLEFEEKFDLFSTDEKEVREIFAPDVMEAIHDLYMCMRTRVVCFAFYKDQFVCMYSMGGETHKPLVEKEPMSTLFSHILILRSLPNLMNRKVLAAAWQEKEHLQQRAQQHKTDMQEKEKEHLAFLQQTAAVNTPDVQGFTPIMHSILDNNTADFEQQIKDPLLYVNQQFIGNGSTLLHLAAANNRIQMARALLAHPDLQINLKNDGGHTALDVARERGYGDMVQLLENTLRE